jgi:hypothetical protein
MTPRSALSRATLRAHKEWASSSVCCVFCGATLKAGGAYRFRFLDTEGASLGIQHSCRRCAKTQRASIEEMISTAEILPLTNFPQ